MDPSLTLESIGFIVIIQLNETVEDSRTSYMLLIDNHDLFLQFL
jgi:hypothetical protein